MCNPSAGNRSWGFRFSALDAIALLIIGAVILGLYWLDSKLWWLVAIVVGHFFLFCNIFRVVRRRELIWSALFVLNVAFWLLLHQLECFEVLACQLPVSAGVIAWELKAKCYHGILADRLNPALKDYLEKRIS